MSNNWHFKLEKPWFIGVVAGMVMGALLLVSNFLRAAESPSLCATTFSTAAAAAVRDDPAITQSQLNTILHYATSRVVPQQTREEIMVSFDVLQSFSKANANANANAACNFLVFGLGHDSLMWASFNPRGTTLFLEEDPKWVQQVLRTAPNIHAYTVQYRTKLIEAKKLIKSYNSEPNCWPSTAFLRGNIRCRLALDTLPDEVYDKDWDVIMIDAPRGYFPAAPGRMAAIYSAAVMAMKRQRSGVTHVFLHDVDRTVEKTYAELFLCRKYLKTAVGRLYHFEIPAAANKLSTGNSFC